MSRFYEMSIKIDGVQKEHIHEIMEICEDEWNFKEWDVYKNKENNTVVLSSYGQGSLCGGEAEEEFAYRLTETIWTKLGYFVNIRIGTTYLEAAPFEEYTFTKEDYDEQNI